ncbi:MAG: gamma-glutamyl-gamma-aminobutyrate hydrolase family protein [Bacteroidales bacterium]|nr:gamma-glutamyl-gamma-aminobutyrate hydrolase family protein [Bacteroidales bacterium]
MKSRLFLFGLVAILLISCGKSSMKHRPIKLALSSATDNYINWIHRIDSTVVIYDLKNLKPDSAISILKKCDGLLLTGGEDVFPGFYGQISDTARCETNIVRDSLEFYLITKAEKLKLPILGICRGLQIMNVAHGGKLIIDIKIFPAMLITGLKITQKPSIESTLQRKLC